ncbi:hypothetical protein KEM54_005815 [Ascosphaera aggregata]|nr:hypothetical protein KEM54_005815 [Ascosphaera aggregata]
METANVDYHQELLVRLRHATDDDQRIEQLRAVKTTIPGNELRKEELINDNGLHLLASLLERRKNGKASESYAQEAPDAITGSSVVSNEDCIAIHTAEIIGMLANGGPPFVYPIFAAGCIPLLLSMLAYPVPNLRFAVLETLTSIVDNLPLDYERVWPAGKELAAVAFSQPYVAYLVDVLNCHPRKSQRAGSKKLKDTTSTRCFKLAANFISRTCIDDHSKIMLGCSGAVNALSYKIASFIVAQGLVLPGAERFAREAGALGSLPLPTYEDSSVLTAALSAISVIIGGSKGRAEHFLSSPALVTVFPQQACKTALQTQSKRLGKSSTSKSATAPAWGRSAWTPTQNRGGSWDCRYPNPVDALLPPFKLDEPSDSSFPSLTSAAEMQASLNFNKEEFEGPTKGSTKEVKEESPFISWLIYMIYTGAATSTESGIGGCKELRVAASTLLVELFDLKLVKVMRVPYLTVLVIPILLKIVEGGFQKPKTRQEMKSSSDEEGEVSWKKSKVKIAATVVLARLIKSIRDRKETQTFANNESNVVASVVKGLQRTFTPGKETNRPIWSPHKRNTSSDTSPTSKADRPTNCPTSLGPPDLSKHVISQLQAREKYLLALTNLAVYNEDVRASLAERGTLNCVLNSMKARELEDQPRERNQEGQQEGQPQGGQTDDTPPTPAASNDEESTRQLPEIEQNSIAVIQAACMAARALCRSPKLMRTNLKEAEMSKPAIKLLAHPDVDIKLAATAVLCNLTLDFSPMKVHVMEQKALGMLCAQARSSNIKLQIESLWALKHIVLEQPDRFRILVLNELGIEAILSAMSYESRELVTHRDTGESVSECANVLSFCDLQDLCSAEAPEATAESENPCGISLATIKAINPVLERMSRNEKLQLEADLEYIKQLRKDKSELIEQSIDLIRNLTCGGDDCPIVLDHIIAQCGFQRLCSLITQRLDDYTLRSDVYGDQVIPAPEQIVLTISYALINISACSPVHANMLVSHPRLMELIVKMLRHRMRRVRCNASWTLYNLVSSGKAVDVEGCRRRAQQVSQMGAEDILQKLQRQDKDVDVRERARQVIKGLREMLGRQSGVNGNVTNGTAHGNANVNGTDVDMEL